MGDSIDSLREKLKNKDLSFEKRQDYREKLIKLIKDKSIVKFDSGNPVEYHIVYDTFSGTLEPIYFWTLDFLRSSDPSGLGFEVDKTGEEFEATAGGGFFGDVGTKASVMQDRAMGILGKVNDILRTIINLIYDLKEFDMRLQAYDNSKSKKKDVRDAGIYSLKGIWMDQVDIKMGLGSINQLTRGDLQFVTLRDAFMQAKNLRDINKMDLNKRVKTILKKKLGEYEIWRDESETELRKRYDIEKHYLKAQVDSLKLYTNWARPYLKAAQKLGMKEFKTKAGLPSPDMVTTFDTMQMELKLFAKKPFKPVGAHESYSNLKFKTSYNSCIDVQFLYRTAPQVTKQGQSQHFGHMGTVEVWFRAYCFTDKDLEDVYAQEVYEDMALVEELTNMSLGRLQEDLDEYLYHEKKEEKKEEGADMFSAISEGFSGIGKTMKKFKLDKLIPQSEKKAGKFEEAQVKKAAKSKAKDSCYALYMTFKKAHRMTTW
jgi:hypothetical protein